MERPSFPPEEMLANAALFAALAEGGKIRMEITCRRGMIISYLSQEFTLDPDQSRYAADPDRIYCTGFSNGASMTFSVGLRNVAKSAMHW